jgi:hypothetical protein
MRCFAAVFQKTLRKLSHGSAKSRTRVSVHQTISRDFDELVLAQVLLLEDRGGTHL